MLLYLRKRDLLHLEKEIEEEDKPSHLVRYFLSIQQKEEEEKKARDEANRWFSIYVPTFVLHLITNYF